MLNPFLLLVIFRLILMTGFFRISFVICSPKQYFLKILQTLVHYKVLNHLCWKLWLLGSATWMILYLTCPLRRVSIGLEAWTMARLTYVLKFNFYLEGWGNEDQTLNQFYFIIPSIDAVHFQSDSLVLAWSWHTFQASPSKCGVIKV